MIGRLAGLMTRIGDAWTRLRAAPLRSGIWVPATPFRSERAFRGTEREVRCPVDTPCLLGEGPLWSARDGALYWLDIRLQRLHAYRPSAMETRTWRLPAPTGAAVEARDGGLLIATARGIGRFDPGGGRFDVIADTAPDWPRSRYNDGACDRAGRFWTGTTRLMGARGLEKLYRLGPQGRRTCLDDGFTICNGLGWSPDDTRLYFTDSHAGRVYAYDFDAETGDLANRRDFARLEPTDGVPDGLAVDAEGCVWVALWGGWRLVRYDPAGRIERTVKLPVPRPTSCAFGGPELTTLYVTSARGGLSPRALVDAPLSGRLLAIESGVVGLPAFAFGSPEPPS